MLVDHTAIVVSLSALSYQTEYIDMIRGSLGRFAFPLFSVVLAHNYFKYTKNKKKFILQLLLFAIVSQPFFTYCLNEYKILNILFTFFVGVAIYYVREEMRSETKKMHFVFLPVLFILAMFTSYGVFGVGLVFVSFIMVKNYNSLNTTLFTFLLIIVNLDYLVIDATVPFVLALIAIIFLIPLIRKTKITIKRSSKYFFYVFYPLHLFVIYFIVNLI